MADDELNQNQNQEGEESGQSEASGISELESLVAQKEEELAEANGRIAELEQVVAETEEKLTTINNSLTEAVASYKAMVIQANPEVLEELVTGDTIESINDSLKQAKTLIGRVRQGLEVEISAAKIPAGAPQRTPLDLSSLSPREKIRYAIGGKK